MKLVTINKDNIFNIEEVLSNFYHKPFENWMLIIPNRQINKFGKEFMNTLVFLTTTGMLRDVEITSLFDTVDGYIRVRKYFKYLKKTSLGIKKHEILTPKTKVVVEAKEILHETDYVFEYLCKIHLLKNIYFNGPITGLNLIIENDDLTTLDGQSIKFDMHGFLRVTRTEDGALIHKFNKDLLHKYIKATKEDIIESAIHLYVKRMN
jgi:flagellar biosynthesis regulator FlbT